MRVILGLTLRRSLRRTLLLGVALGTFLFLVGLSYASVGQNQIRSLVESLPPAIRAFVQGADLASPAGYLGSGFIHPITLAVLATTAIAAGAASARDVEHGVAELLLSRPLRRTAWIGAELIALEISLAIVTVLGAVGAFIAVGTIHDLGTVPYGSVALTALAMFLLFSGIGAITSLAASFSRTGARAIGMGAGVALVFYAIDYLAQIWSLAKPFGPISLLHWYRPSNVLGTGSIPTSSWLVLVGVAVVASGLALLVTSRREVAP